MPTFIPIADSDMIDESGIIEMKADSEDFERISSRIVELKKSLNAVIVAHNYQRPEVQDIADFVGDSLELARKCTQVDAKVIVFCRCALHGGERVYLESGSQGIADGG